MKKSLLIVLAAAALGAASCSTGKESNTVETAETEYVSTPYSGSLAGEWLIEDIVIYDTLSIKPSEIESDEAQTAMFTDSTYHFKTNCNLVQGDYVQSGDSISFSAGMSTRMACPDMSVEDALVQILPQINGVAMDNDSILRLYAGNPSAYILLKKMK